MKSWKIINIIGMTMGVCGLALFLAVFYYVATDSLHSHFVLINSLITAFSYLFFTGISISFISIFVLYKSGAT